MTAPLHVELGFTRPSHVSPDEERPGRLRARTLPPQRDLSLYEFRSFPIHDCLDPEVTAPDLEVTGFEAIDLTGNAELQGVLARIRDTDRLSETDATAVRASLDRAELPLSRGRCLRVLHVAEEGMIHRRAGPNGLDVNPGGMDGTNNHDAARIIHGDQDVYGTPLKQMMNGGAPSMFRHRSPDGSNDDATLFLVNLWIPIQQITRPLVLMDRRTLDAQRHQLRYGLPVTSFLDREDARSVNDIWAFLADEGQRWYYRSEMGPDTAWIFDTLGEPHGACILPGEDVLEALYAALASACDATEAGDPSGLREAATQQLPSLPDETTDAIRRAETRMRALLEEAASDPAGICDAAEAWNRRARDAMDAVLRKSIEMRVVANLESPH